MTAGGADGGLVCPAPRATDVVQLAHGGGGRLMHELLRTVFLPAFGDPLETGGHDSAVFTPDSAQLAFTTDGYVVQPLEFPGGDIGSLAVHGTVNDLLMAGARPRHLSASFILEAGLPLATLRRIVASMRDAAAASGVSIVTGDTKVVEAGHGDGIYLATSGVGALLPGVAIGPRAIRPGDRIILSGDIGRHGMAVMAAREDLALATAIESDSAPLTGAVLPLLEAGVTVSCLRDLTRGGLASALVELAGSAGATLAIDESRVPVREDVRALCELLGLDPLHVANEGRFIALVPEREAGRALNLLRQSAVAADARDIGEVRPGAGEVRARTAVGTERPLDMLTGEQLPRIC
ncbi:MAG: hydrogenase expression/formation protein HypE [Pseudohaliea sp.]